uniref:Uncharacterized protein n=1 Tax=Rheinheimera sp. BAL341 TaxID=1708203 RepID=A0A486XUU7_9GAMM
MISHCYVLLNVRPAYALDTAPLLNNLHIHTVKADKKAAGL